MLIHGVATSRTRRCLWTAEEAGADYEFVKLDFSSGEHLSDTYLKINPNGRVPAMEDDGIVLFESAAICLYIARKYPEAKLLPEPGSKDAAVHEQWMFWVVSEIEQSLWSMGKHKFALPKEHRIKEMQQTALFEWHRAKKVLDAAIGERSHIVGDHITVADIMIGHTLAWARGFKVPFESDNLERYLDEMLARPSYKATKRFE